MLLSAHSCFEVKWDSSRQRLDNNDRVLILIISLIWIAILCKVQLIIIIFQHVKVFLGLEECLLLRPFKTTKFIVKILFFLL